MFWTSLYKTPTSTFDTLSLDAWIYNSWLLTNIICLKAVSEDNWPLWFGFITSVEIFDVLSPLTLIVVENISALDVNLTVSPAFNWIRLNIGSSGYSISK